MFFPFAAVRGKCFEFFLSFDITLKLFNHEYKYIKDKIMKHSRLVFFTFLFAALLSGIPLMAAEITVSPDGPVPNLQKAQEIWRKKMADGEKEIIVRMKSGDYCLTEPLVLDETDRKVPLTIEAAPSERPVLHGSQEIQGWKKGENGIFRAVLTPEQAKFPPAQLFGNMKRLIRARYPNFDVQNPYKGGFLYVNRGHGSNGTSADISGSVGNIHNAGDSLFYEVEIPKTGKYQLWMWYGANNASYGLESLDGRLTMTVDNNTVLPLTGVVNTGAWTSTHWARCAETELTAGRHTLVWCNVKGGGINLSAFALSPSSEWDPNRAENLENPSADGIVLIPADAFVKGIGKQLEVTHTGSKKAFCFAPGELKPQWAQPGVELKIFQSGSCRAFLEMTQIAEIDAVKNIVRLEGPECVANLAKGDRYFLENHPDFLDAPGEWYYDAATRTLSVIPADSEDPENFIYRTDTIGTLISVTGAGKKAESEPALLRISGLRFSETSFTHDDGCIGYSMGNRGVIELKQTSGVSVENCRFLNIGRYAVCVTEGGKNRVVSCNISHSGQGGVILLGSSGNEVTENRIKYVGEMYKHIGGVVLESGSSENVIARNFIQYSSRYGISMKDAGGKNLIEENEVRDTSLETYDTGAIEVTQGNRSFQSGTVIRGNRIYNTNGFSCVGELERYMSWGIYLDSFAGGYTVEDNYVEHSSHGGFMLQGGKGNVVRNNVFVDGIQYQGFFANYIQNCENLVFEKNKIVILNPKAVLFHAGKNLPAVLKCDENTYWCPTEDVRERSDFKAWKAMGFDANCRVEAIKYE